MPDLQAPQPVLKTMAPVKTSDTSKGMTVFVLTVTTLYFGKEVLVPITLALLLAFILEPLVAILRRAHFGRVPSVPSGGGAGTVYYFGYWRRHRLANW